MSNRTAEFAEVATRFGLSTDDFTLIAGGSESPALARGRIVPLVSALQCIVPAAYHQVLDANLAALGIEVVTAPLQTNERVVGLFGLAPGGRPAAEVVWGEGESEESQGGQWLRLAPGSAARVSSSSGSLVVARGPSGAYAVALAPNLTVPAFGELAPDAGELLAPDAPAWLRHEVANRCAVPGATFLAAEAAGLAARHTNLADARKALDDLLAGREPALSPAHRWFFALSSAQWTDIEDLAVVAAQQLTHQVLDLAESAQPADPQWQQSLQAACCDRDALEGVRALLHAVNGGTTFADTLYQLDRHGLDLGRSLQASFRMVNEHLQAACACDPDAWWTQWTAET